MNAYQRMPALLRRIGALESGRVLCRRRYCYAEAFSWLPYCEIHQEPAPFRFSEPTRFNLTRFALQAEFRLGYGIGIAPPRSLSPFVAITAC